MRLRRIARPLARKGLSVIAVFLPSEFSDFRWNLERRALRRLRSQPIVTDQLSWSNPKNADRGRRGDDDVVVPDSPKRRCEVDDRG